MLMDIINLNNIIWYEVSLVFSVNYLYDYNIITLLY